MLPRSPFWILKFISLINRHFSCQFLCILLSFLCHAISSIHHSFIVFRFLAPLLHRFLARKHVVAILPLGCKQRSFYAVPPYTLHLFCIPFRPCYYISSLILFHSLPSSSFSSFAPFLSLHPPLLLSLYFSFLSPSPISLSASSSSFSYSLFSLFPVICFNLFNF